MPPVPDGLQPSPVDLTIVVPAFNEAHRLGAGMERFDAAVSSGAVDLDRTEVVVVDDGSTDGTASEAAKVLAAVPRHRVIRLPGNRGKGAAVRAGIAASRSPYTAYMDADMAIDPKAVPRLLDGLDDHDVAIGCRALPDSMVETSYLVRSLMGQLFNKVVTAGTGLTLKDTQCGFKAFRTPVARLLFHMVRIDRFAFDVEILARATRLGLGITEVPVHWMHVEGSTVHPLPDSIRMLSDVYRSRWGHLAGPPVPALVVTDPRGTAGTDIEVVERMARLIGPEVGGAPVSVLTRGSTYTAVLAMVDPADVSRAHTAVRDGLASFSTAGTALSLTDLIALGPLGGRLDARGGGPDPQ